MTSARGRPTLSRGFAFTVRRPRGGAVSLSALYGRIEAVLREWLAHAGLGRVSFRFRHIRGTHLVTFEIISAGFRELGPRERQALVWRALETDLSRDDHMRVCVVLALTPKEDEAKS